MKKINDLENLSKKYRKDLFEKLLLVKQGHPGSIFSMMDIVVSLYRNGFPLGDWASKIVEVVITKEENSEIAKENNKQDNYNYEPDFKKSNDKNKIILRKHKLN